MNPKAPSLKAATKLHKSNIRIRPIINWKNAPAYELAKQLTKTLFLVAPTLGSLLPLLEHRAEFPQFLDQGQSVGPLGRVISSSQGLYAYTNTEKRTHIHRH
jgi:hypothetical protein